MPSAVFIRGVQSITGSNNSIDLCTAGGYNLYLQRCQDVDIQFIWLASNPDVSPTHRGVCFDDCTNSTIRVGSFKNHQVCYVETVNKLAGKWAGNKLQFNTCENQTQNVALWDGVTGSTVEPGFAIKTASPRSATSDYEFYATGGADFIKVGFGAQSGTSYVQPSLGANSHIDHQMFI